MNRLKARPELLAVGFIDVLLAFPALVLALTFVAYLGQSLFNVTLALGILSIPAAARLMPSLSSPAPTVSRGWPPCASATSRANAPSTWGTPAPVTALIVMRSLAGASPTALTTTQLSTLANVSAIAISANQVLVEAVPAFGQDDAAASFAVAGSRQSDQIPVQSKPTSMTIVAPWNPSDAGLLLMRADAYSGIIDRTFVVSATDGTNIVYYAFNARVGQFQIDAQPGAEAKCVFTIHPRGNLYGWSNNA